MLLSACSEQASAVGSLKHFYPPHCRLSLSLGLRQSSHVHILPRVASLTGASQQEDRLLSEGTCCEPAHQTDSGSPFGLLRALAAERSLSFPWFRYCLRVFFSSTRQSRCLQLLFGSVCMCCSRHVALLVDGNHKCGSASVVVLQKSQKLFEESSRNYKKYNNTRIRTKSKNLFIKYSPNKN